MRLAWMFLPRENPCAKFYIIIIIVIIIIIIIIKSCTPSNPKKISMNCLKRIHKLKKKKIHEAQEFLTPNNCSYGPPHKLTAARTKEADVSSNIFILSSTSGMQSPY